MNCVLKVVLALAAAGVAFPSYSADRRVAFSPEGDFSEETIRRGVVATSEQCSKVSNAVWANTKEDGSECIKYWASGFSGRTTQKAVVFFHGDVWLGPGKTNKTYLQQSNKKVQQSADNWSRRLAAPYIFVGRPGTYGSSGDHMQRRRPAESLLLSAALDKIREKLQIKELVVAGQSGGGHVTSSLITYRNDIVCAVPTSAPASPRVRWTITGMAKDTTGYRDSYEPTEHLNKATMNKSLRVFVLGNPNDANVVWPSQTIMADQLQKAGIPVATLQGEGTGPEAHGLRDSAHKVAGWCFHDLPTDEIVRKAAKGLRG